MGEKRSSFLFNTIAPIYGLFFNWQKRNFSLELAKIDHELNLTNYSTILDVGCGTGALCSVLDEMELLVTGIDPAEQMLKIANKKTEKQNISFSRANVLGSLPFKNNDFDIAIASHVAHGLLPEERKHMYKEMSRVCKSKVIIYDYNEKRSLLITLIEWFEGGDYFHFIKNAELEMRNCIAEMKECFSEVKVIDTDGRTAWYICTPVVHKRL